MCCVSDSDQDYDIVANINIDDDNNDEFKQFNDYKSDSDSDINNTNTANRLRLSDEAGQAYQQCIDASRQAYNEYLVNTVNQDQYLNNSNIDNFTESKDLYQNIMQVSSTIMDGKHYFDDIPFSDIEANGGTVDERDYYRYQPLIDSDLMTLVTQLIILSLTVMFTIFIIFPVILTPHIVLIMLTIQ